MAELMTAIKVASVLVNPLLGQLFSDPATTCTRGKRIWGVEGHIL